MGIHHALSVPLIGTKNVPQVTFTKLTDLVVSCIGDVSWNASKSGNSLAPIAIRYAPLLAPPLSRRAIPLPSLPVRPPGSLPSSPLILPQKLPPLFAPL